MSSTKNTSKTLTLGKIELSADNKYLNTPEWNIPNKLFSVCAKRVSLSLSLILGIATLIMVM